MPIRRWIFSMCQNPKKPGVWNEAWYEWDTATMQVVRCGITSFENDSPSGEEGPRRRVNDIAHSDVIFRFIPAGPQPMIERKVPSEAKCDIDLDLPDLPVTERIDGRGKLHRHFAGTVQCAWDWGR